jgi:hypothetical protein
MSISNVINMSSNIIQYEHKYLILKVNNILVENFAKILYNTIIKLPDKYWYNMTCMDNEKDECKLISKNKNRIKHFNKKANKSFSKNNFSFNFHKTMIFTNKEITQIEYTLRNVLSSNQFINYINKILKGKFRISQLNSMFVSRYRSGHFLAPHLDKNNGKLAFVINLSRNWFPKYGGNLHFLNDNRTEILHTLTPTFNNLVLFEVPPEGIPHYVSHVAPNVKNTRYAVSGWYS